MKRATRNSAIALAVTSGAIAVAGPAQADSTANGAATGSPGPISGNAVQLPAHIPANICGNTIDVTGLLNPAIGNTCTNREHTALARTPGRTTATGHTHDSPGAVSGNTLQLPVQLPLNVSGNTANLSGAGNPALGNDSTNSPDNQPSQPTRTTSPIHTTPPARTTPPTRPAPHQQPAPLTTPNTPHMSTHTRTHHDTGSSLAQTGTDGTWSAAAASITALIGGATLYRRFRPPTTR
ncbi:chaplin [Streptomyces monashensis]|uniref:chaplin n=1 Tax=Streptomyces monashensis TaxID=1678012 RepID=UPI0009A1239F|nr:chaplin [Streptomyces monashensis]